MEEQIGEKIKTELNKSLVSCEKCHFCNLVCPIVDSRVTQGPFGINRSVYYALKWNQIDESLRNLVYSCTTCKKCVAMCKKISRGLPLVEIIENMRELLIYEMKGPMPGQAGVLKNMHIRGNPWGYPAYERTKWATGLDVKFANSANKVDVLYFVGCASSYDSQGQKIAKSLCFLLKKAGINFGILEKESCSGHEAKRMGEIGLFEFLSENNMKMFEETGALHLVTGDPHSFYSFTHEYPFEGKNLKIQHSSQFFNDLIDQGKLTLSSKINKKVTYHDSCYLGRHSGIFEDPRKLIQRIPGIILVEMENSKEDSDCCGMGGGRMWMEPPKGLVSSQKIAEKRVQQALEVGAEILLTSCPFCKITLTDAVKALEKEEKITVMDITELVAMAV